MEKPLRSSRRVLAERLAFVLLTAAILSIAVWAIVRLDRIKFGDFEASDYEELLRRSRLERSMLPDSLPQSAREINVSYDLDVWAVEATFRIDRADLGELTEEYREVDPRTLAGENVESDGNANRFRYFRNVRESSGGRKVQLVTFDDDTGHVRYTSRYSR